MEWHNIAGLFSTVALFSPVFIILAFRFIRYPQYLALFIYCFSAFVYNLMTEQYLVVPREVQRTFGIVYNFLDAPLMLTFLMIFTTSKKQRNLIKVSLGLFLLFEMLVILLKGVSLPAIVVVMGPGIILVFAFSLFFFIEYIKKSFMYPKFAGKALMITGICFAYGCFGFLYIMFYIFVVPESAYIYFVYFTITIIYSSLISTGLIFESRRKRKLEEVMHTRKELMSFFEEENKPVNPGKNRNQLGLN